MRVFCIMPTGVPIEAAALKR
ncbi:protein of unknown function (plasmid) [Caballeronia sp. S22]